MLYFSRSIGGGSLAAGTSHPTFGLRLQQVRQGSNSGAPDSGDVMHRRELLNWQMEARPDFHLGDMRVQLGHRLTYDITNARFGSPRRSTIRLDIPSLRDALPRRGISGAHAPVHVTARPRSPSTASSAGDHSIPGSHS